MSHRTAATAAVAAAAAASTAATVKRGLSHTEISGTFYQCALGMRGHSQPASQPASRTAQSVSERRHSQPIGTER